MDAYDIPILIDSGAQRIRHTSTAFSRQLSLFRTTIRSIRQSSSFRTSCGTRIVHLLYFLVKILNLSAVYPSGEVCISILHPPGDDPSHYEHSSERWSPVQSVEKILISVMSMLAGTLITHQMAFVMPLEPNIESPANVDAAKMWRDERRRFFEIVRQQVMKTLDLA